MCLFVPTRTAPDARKHSRLGKPGKKLATELCLFVPAPKVAVRRKLLKRFGVPHGPYFEPKALAQNQSRGLETQNLAQLRTLLVALCA